MNFVISVKIHMLTLLKPMSRYLKGLSIARIKQKDACSCSTSNFFEFNVLKAD